MDASTTQEHERQGHFVASRTAISTTNPNLVFTLTLHGGFRNELGEVSPDPVHFLGLSLTMGTVIKTN